MYTKSWGVIEIMYRDVAYAILSKELNRWKSKTNEEVIAAAGSTKASIHNTQAGEEIKMEVTTKWIDEEKKKIRIEAVAYGPSHWKLERLEEKVTIDLTKTK